MWSEERYKAFMARQVSGDEDQLQLESYTATIEPVDASKREFLHQLVMMVFWPHRSRDIDLFLSLGKGYVASDEIGRPLASAMYFPMGDDFSMCGMMVVTPRLQSQGAGRRLLRRIMRDNEGRDLRVTATRSAFRLYESAGFAPVAEISQHQGVARPVEAPELPAGCRLRPMTPGDEPALRALDLHAYGADRSALYTELMTRSDGLVLERDGQIRGFAMKRPFGKGTVIGPVIAETDEMAVQLVAPLIRDCAGQFTRMDTQIESTALKQLLAQAGMGVIDTVTEMWIGTPRRATTGARVYGLASHSLG
ncbi:GNAT family N-acetyltransferase [Pseudooceanicola marinus]|uniref:GNAT family N-acetyltransferase n=1 Tax=Pseudooceanicola marinus TaxID=396013 RepID=UPI001CD1B442|nr:GNAT family N-acetyltransferase [Pseudooceanicola marinus]MCA1335880.1 GNAT family N-acetyltransferase [Pseudooceanicola marinus]